MKLTDDQIRSIMQKEIACKSLLCDTDEIDEVINKHKIEGWKLVSKSEINGRVKLTFKK